MGIGTSSGAYYDDAHHRAAADWDDKYDENIVVPHPTGDINDMSPDKMMGDKQIATDPGNIYDDSGNIVDYKPNGEWGQSDLPTLKPMKQQEKIYLNNEPSPLDKQSNLESMIKPVSDIKTYGMNPMIDVPEGTLPVVGGGKGPEKIKSAALQIGKDTIEGGNHGLAFEKWMNANPNQMPKDFKDGFTTTHGRFVSREEAMDIAKKNDQLHPNVKAAIAKLNAANDDSTMLLSEDLQ